MKRSEHILIALFLLVSCTGSVQRHESIVPRGDVPGQREEGRERIPQSQPAAGNTIERDGPGGRWILRIEGGNLVMVQPGEDGEIRCNVTAVHGNTGIRRFIVHGSAGYVLLDDGRFFRVAGVGSVESRTGVSDAVPVRNGIATVENRKGKTVFMLGAVELPLDLEGPAVVSSVVDDRIVFITAGGESEVVDSSAMISLYMYPAGGSYLKPGGDNLKITVRDITGSGERNDDSRMVFFMVYIDGVETGRTPTGPAVLARTQSMQVEPGVYHIVRLERWELDRTKQRYERANNVFQPEGVKLMVPLNRVVEYECLFDGKNYTFSVRSLR